MPDGIRLFFRRFGSGPGILIPNGIYYQEALLQFADRFTLVFLDVRNRGYSDAVGPDQRSGIVQDIDDIEFVRDHLGWDSMRLIGHSYMGLGVALYAIRHPDRVRSLVQLSPMEPDGSRQYPAELSNNDGVAAEVSNRLAALFRQERLPDPVENCKRYWAELKPIFVADPVHVAELAGWERCDSANERAFFKYWMETLIPSIRAVSFTRDGCSAMRRPVLIVHGRKDRSAPYGGALDWQALWPDAELLTLEDVAHAPWIEARELVLAKIKDFLTLH
jgi:pimeloyl-ACP methyl ester carboxylesterase